VRGVLLFSHQRFEAAIEALRAEIQSNPQDPFAYSQLASTYIFIGDPAPAIPLLEQALRLSPRDPMLSTHLRTLAHAHLQLGQHAPGLIAAQRSVAAPNPPRLAHLTLACAYGLSGREVEARAAMDEFRRRMPSYTLAQLLQDQPSTRPAYVARRQSCHDTYLKAGLPAS
jgi:tetratricopeptide (TPR) repeat protein